MCLNNIQQKRNRERETVTKIRDNNNDNQSERHCALFHSLFTGKENVQREPGAIKYGPKHIHTRWAVRMHRMSERHRHLVWHTAYNGGRHRARKENEHGEENERNNRQSNNELAIIGSECSCNCRCQMQLAANVSPFL